MKVDSHQIHLANTLYFQVHISLCRYIFNFYAFFAQNNVCPTACMFLLKNCTLLFDQVCYWESTPKILGLI